MLIMIAEDEELARKATVRLIRKLYSEVEIVEASDGAEAVTLVSDYNPDIIFMDVMMPVMTGIEASEAILARVPDIYIYLLTAYDSFSFVQKAINTGIRGYILKPPSCEDIKKAVDKALHQKKEEHVERQNRDAMAVAMPTENRPGYPSAEEKEIIANLRRHNVMEARRMGRDLLREILDSGNVNVIIQEYINEFFVIIKRCLIENGYATTEDVDSIIREYVYAPDDCEKLRKRAMEGWQNLMDLCGKRASLSEKHKSSVLKAIEEDVAGITIEMLAQQEGVSKSYISRSFTAWTNDSFSNYLTERRIEKARTLLETTSLKIEAVGMAVGYADMNYFCRVFKKRVGVSPAQYRRYKHGI